MTSIREVLNYEESLTSEDPDELSFGARSEEPSIHEDDLFLDLDSIDPDEGVAEPTNKYKAGRERLREERLAQSSCECRGELHQWNSCGPREYGYRWRCRKCHSYTTTASYDERPPLQNGKADPGVSPDRPHVGSASDRNQQQH